MVAPVSDGASPTPPYSGNALACLFMSTTGLSPPMATLPMVFVYEISSALLRLLQPRLGRNPAGLGCCAFARHYLRNHYCFLLLPLLRCFSSGRLLTINRVTLARWVAPFGYPWITGPVRLPRAFRSLARPSSPQRATGIPRVPYRNFLITCCYAA